MRASIHILVLLTSLPLLAGCGSDEEYPPGGGAALVSVTSITSPLAAHRPARFTITGSNFQSLAGTTATVTFRARSGTPFVGGTEAEVKVQGSIDSNTTITGTAPLARLSGTDDFDVFVTLPGGARSATREVKFTAPMIFGLGRFGAAAFD